MQWNSTNLGGFTAFNSTWLGINPNFTEINVEAQEKDSDSILHFYKTMIKLRNENDVLIYGTYQLVLEEHPEVYVYTRTLEDQSAIVICNLTGNESKCELPAGFVSSSSELVLCNYHKTEKTLKRAMTLRPYETRIYLTAKSI
jgi:alpha-glucosidase